MYTITTNHSNDKNHNDKHDIICTINNNCWYRYYETYTLTQFLYVESD